MTARTGSPVFGRPWLAGLAALAMSLFCLALEPSVNAQANTPAATLERVFAEQAVKLLEICRQKGYQNVGVLKFRVQKGQEKPSDNVGPLNMTLADKLQKALILKNSKKNEVGIIRDASRVAYNTKGANHLQQGASRQKLFDANFPLAWGDKEVKADAFIFGTARLEPNMKEMTIALFTVDKKQINDKCEQVIKFNAATDVSTLVDAGESFALRGVFDQVASTNPPPPYGAKEHLDSVVTDAVKVYGSAAKHPLHVGNCPVILELYYDDRRVDYQIVNGKALIVPPHEGQKVYFLIKRNAPGTYGVCLKVNGINTVFEERFPADQCTKWILEPEVNTIKVEGYYQEAGTYEAFRVASLQESRALEMNYGEDVGQIAFTVFRERYVGSSGPQLPPEPLLGEAGAEEDTIRGALLPTGAKSLSALKSQLLEGDNRGGRVRGLILAGEKKAGEVRKIPFEADPQPILNAIITYYQKTGS